MKSDLLVQRVLWPLVKWLSAANIVCVLLWECVCVHMHMLGFSQCVSLWYWDCANQCCLGLAVRHIHLDLALIISVVIFSKWFGFAVCYMASLCVSVYESVAALLLLIFSHCFFFFVWLMRIQSTVSGQQNPTTTKKTGRGCRTWGKKCEKEKERELLREKERQ